MSEPEFKPGLPIPTSWFFPQQQYIPEILDPKWMLEIISSRNDRYILNDVPTLNCSRLPGVCAEKNMGTYCRLSGKKCHDWFAVSATGTSARYLPTLTWFSPTTFTAGNIDAGRFKKNCPKTRSVVLAETHWVSPSPDSIPGALGRALDLPLELSWETCQITLSLWISFWPCFSVSYHLCTSSE